MIGNHFRPFTKIQSFLLCTNVIYYQRNGFHTITNTVPLSFFLILSFQLYGNFYFVTKVLSCVFEISQSYINSTKTHSSTYLRFLLKENNMNCRTPIKSKLGYRRFTIIIKINKHKQWKNDQKFRNTIKRNHH